MLILGNRYRFSNKEKIFLENRFKKLLFLSYSNKNNKDALKKIIRIIKNNSIKTIVLNIDTNPTPLMIKFLSRLEERGVKFITIENFLETNFHKCLIDNYSKRLIYLENIKPLTNFQYIQKRFLDYIMVILLFFPFVISAIITKYKIYKQSPGDLFFIQKRVGINNKEFKCIKLRSMRMDAEKDGPMFAKELDSRTYPWGSIIRANKIDELGQLINIIKGEMHFVGPRPERRVWIKEFEKNIPYYNLRHIVKPGIAGLAQLEYQYEKGGLTAKQKLMYDLYYIKHWSIWLDIKIITKTALFVLSKFK